MKTYMITVSDGKDAALQVIAKRDKITVQELVQAQMDYYLNVVIRGYVETPAILTDEQKTELNVMLAKTKANYLATIGV